MGGGWVEKPFLDAVNSTDAKIGILFALQTFGVFLENNDFQVKENENRRRKKKNENRRRKKKIEEEKRKKKKEKRKEKGFALNKNMDRHCETDGCQFQKMSQKEQ